MADKIKTAIAEIVAIVKDCPENLQEKCFEDALVGLSSITGNTEKAHKERS